MNPRNMILAFLAARYPAAYADTVIHQRVNKSGLLDKSEGLDEVQHELRTLANTFGFVKPDLEIISGKVYWTATVSGTEQWHLDGATHVG